MRTAFSQTIAELGERDPRILLLTGDLGFMALEQFSDRFPDRFFNVGVAEQNMVGLATGLAEAGLIPFVYSIVTFAALRPYEFIRNGPVLHQLPVRIVAVGGGVEYGTAGPTHHGLEDVGVMRLQPGLTVVAPADPDQARTVFRSTWDLPGPIYYRIGKNDKAVVPGLDGRFELGRLQMVREGRDLLILSMGGISNEAALAAEQLASRGLSPAFGVVASLNPAPTEDLATLLAGYPVVITVESHYVVGGLGSLVSEVVAENGLGCRVVRCGFRAPLGAERSGSQAYIQKVNGISADAICETALETVDRLRSKG